MWMPYGDFFTIRAYSDIKEGEEITVSYAVQPNPRDRLAFFEASYGFRCQCPLCSEEMEDGRLSKRADILEAFNTVRKDSPSAQSVLSAAQKAVDELRKTYKANWKYRFSMVEPLRSLYALAGGDDAIRATEELWEIERNLGLDSVVKTGMDLMARYSFSSRREMPYVVLERCFDWLKKAFGLEPKTFLAAWEPLLKKMKCYSFIEQQIVRRSSE
jgi:hypothetical protein